MPEPTQKNKRYMPGIDGLRAFAVLAVIAYHLNLGWAPGGLLGVGIFFVLSGYLITDLIIAEYHRTGKINFKQFWIRRARRLLPALLSMLALVILWVLLFERSFLLDLWANVLSVLTYVSNWWLIFHKVSYFAQFGPPSPLNHLWSLAVEEQFYLIWPLILLLGLHYIKNKQVILNSILAAAIISAIAMAVLYTPGEDPSRVYYGTDTRAFALLIGAGLAIVWPSRKLSTRLPKEQRKALDMVGILSLFGILLLIGFTSQFDSFLYRGGMVILSIFTLFVVATLAHPSSRLGMVMGCKPLRWIGVRSYGIYLWHFPVIVLSNPAQENVHPSAWLKITQFALIIILATLSWHFVEEPIRHGALQRWRSKLNVTTHSWKRATLVQKSILGCSAAVIVVIFFTVVVPTLHKLEEGQEKKAVQAIMNPEPVKPKEKPKHEQPKPEEKSKPDSGQKPDPKPAPVPPPKPADERISVIGDSVMVNVAPYIKEKFPKATVDAKIGRQLKDASDVIDHMKANGSLGHTVVIGLGTNGPFSKDQLVSVLDKVGKDKEIVLINSQVPRPWEKEVNTTLEEVASSHPHTKLVNWNEASNGQTSYFYNDGVHLKPEGASAYAKLVERAVN
ncbi:acyltransferase family protein [Fictibacillus terranigra]|uniref:Acyltransferase family protein n=1 Tax=Fictibacillus terranigra TaxID=3058424 RepID=A0ABT8E294_9BACL|nr:acyltransferase family protein [Fictibacillus sp. CENA-BCM004]MDN4072034.1 acyltransferase family protein [Fictibacillus sp. CENA-BCM004]